MFCTGNAVLTEGVPFQESKGRGQDRVLKPGTAPPFCPGDAQSGGRVSCCRRIPSQPGAGRAFRGSWLASGVAPDFPAVVGRTFWALANLGFKHVFTEESSMWHQGSGRGKGGGGFGGPAHWSEPGLWHLLLCHLAISSRGKSAVPCSYRTLRYPWWSVSC